MSFRFAPEKRVVIERYLKPLDAGTRERSIHSIELRVGASIRDLERARDGDFNVSEKVKRLGDAEQALKDFSRRLFRTSPDRASNFPKELLELVARDVPPLLVEAAEYLMRSENEMQLRALQSRLIDRRLARLIRELWSLMSQYRADLAEQSAAEPSRRVVERQSILAVADCGCRFYRLAHGRCPSPRKKNGAPDGPFDKFMMTIMDPVAVELRKNEGRGNSYNWPTLMKYAAKARDR
jgi:hypothetical protein